MEEFWNQRYSSKDYAYGEAPNEFFKQSLINLPEKGKILMPADGEGRNGVFAAREGWQVTAFDISSEGRKKALQLAGKFSVSIDYQLKGFDEVDFPDESFDAVGLIFAHSPAEKRPLYHQKVVRWLKPGGVVILEGYAKAQLGKPSGGPPSLSMLFSEEELRSDFSSLKELDIWYEEVVLEEGLYHRGEASVIRMIGKKVS